ncbi:MAG: hypothetical protein Q7S17_04210, partial [Xanthobacteraceae bacterium]|nr:hypothetical protein [Xanthobacteraceae bacterium]
ADIVVRAGWRNARWLDADGKPADMLAILRKSAERGLIDQPIWIGRKSCGATIWMGERRQSEWLCSGRDGRMIVAARQ